MTRRAYRPRQATVDLQRRIAALDGVAEARILAGSPRQRAGIRVYLTHRWPGERVYSDFTLPEARAWLASEEAER